MAGVSRIYERDESGKRYTIVLDDNKPLITQSASSRTRVPITDFLAKVFLPNGYPASVSPDYLRYQVLNSLQAFCSSLAGLISSRSVLEGQGVGNASASATDAVLVKVLQDFFSHITTILGAYYLGSYLAPEAKTYRLLADILNDGAIILDTFSPVFNNPGFPFQFPGLRVAALCISGSLRALCGLVAGGSKSAITLHFASPTSGNGDIGDLNAKDASKETVLSLLGMLLGGVIVPYLTSPWSTYSMLLLLVGLHVLINYLGVKGLVLRSLNRQRLGLAWMWYRRSNDTSVPLPNQISQIERIFDRPGTLRDGNRSIGYCIIGSSLSSVLKNPISPSFVEIFAEERYILWFDDCCLSPFIPGQPRKVVGSPSMHIFLKEGYTGSDQNKAWILAAEIARCVSLPSSSSVGAVDVIERSQRELNARYSDFIKKLRDATWITDGAPLISSPQSVLVASENEERKNQ